MAEHHVIPLGDLVAHEFDECVCGPTVKPIKRDDGSVSWVVIHHSLDHREQRERNPPDDPAPR